MPYLPRTHRFSLQMLVMSICVLGCAGESTLLPIASLGASAESIPEEWGELELSAAVETCTSPADLSYRAELRRRLLDLQPDNAGLKIALGRDLLALGHAELAEAMFHSAATDPVHGVMATMELANLQELDGRLLVAAALLEQKATSSDVADRRMLLERASRLRQNSGDMQGALADLEAAMQGLDVSVGEQRLLEQMQAFERGEFAHADDAIKVFRNHSNQEMRLKAGRYLAEREFTNSAAVFADVLADPNPAILQLAIRELAARGESMDSEGLLPLLDHLDANIRREATTALGQLHNLEAIPFLMERLDPQNRSLFRAQNLALERLTGETLAPDMDANLERRQEIATTWVDWWNEKG